jgi:hypothetical protein
MVMISRDRSMSCFELRIRCLQSALMWCFSMVVERLGRHNKEGHIVRS